MKKVLLVLVLTVTHHAYSWGWVSPYSIKSVNYDGTTKQIQFNVLNPSNPSDPNLGITFIYDCDQSGNSFDEGKMFQSMLMAGFAANKKIGFDTQNISGSTTIWEIRQLKLLGN